MQKLWNIVISSMLVFLVLWNIQLQNQIKELQSLASLAEIQQLVQQIRDELPSLIQRSQITPRQVVVGEGLSDISERMGLLQAGEFRTGNGLEPGLGFSGVRIGYPPFTYNSTQWNIVGVENDVLQIGIRASDGKLVFGAGTGTLSENGIRLENNEETTSISFAKADETYGQLLIYSNVDNDIVIHNLNNTDPDSGIRIIKKLTDGTAPSFRFQENPDVSNMTQFRLERGANGSQLRIGEVFVLEGESATNTRSTFVQMRETTNTPTDDPSSNIDVQFYVRDNKFILRWNDGGTIRYKYLDLTGTGVTWVHTTTAP